MHKNIGHTIIRNTTQQHLILIIESSKIIELSVH